MNSNVLVTGVPGTGIVGTVLPRGWTVVNDAQNTTWVEVDAA